MELLEIIQLGAEGVKKDPNALNIYKRTFLEYFGRIPECPACGLSVGIRDWKAFEALANGETVENIKSKHFSMSQTEINKTFTVYNSHDLVDYIDERDGRYFIERSYVNSMSESFAEKFLETAKDEEEFQKRAKYFSKLPAKFRKSDEEKEADDLLNEIIVENEEEIVTDKLDEIIVENEEEIVTDKLDEIIVENETGIVKNDIEPIEEDTPSEPIKTEEEIKAEKNAKRREQYAKKNK